MESAKRQRAGAAAIEYGARGMKSIAELFQMSTATVSRGMKEVRKTEMIDVERIRNVGGGRKPTTE